VQEVAFRAFDLLFDLGVVVGAVVVFVVLAHFEEHVLQVAVAEPLGKDAECAFVVLQCGEEGALLVHVGLRERELDLDVVLLLDFGLGEPLHECEQLLGLEVGVFLCNQFVAAALLVLEELAGAAAPDFAFTHDGDAVPQVLGLVHVVRGQDHRAVLLDVLEDVPELLAGGDVHAAGGFVQQHQFRVADQRNRHRQPPFSAP